MSPEWHLYIMEAVCICKTFTRVLHSFNSRSILQIFDFQTNQVQRANQLISMESEENVQMTEQLGKYPGPEANKSKQPGTRMPPRKFWGLNYILLQSLHTFH